ncbi:MAG: F-box protein [Gammaproteobacteria bacterium]
MNFDSAVRVARNKSSGDSFFSNLPNDLIQTVLEKLFEVHHAEGEKDVARLSCVSRAMRAAVRDTRFLENARLRVEIYNDKTPHADDYADHSDPYVRKASEIKQLKWIKGGDIKPKDLISPRYTRHPSPRIREAGAARLEQLLKSGNLNAADRLSIEFIFEVMGHLYKVRKEEPDTHLNKCINEKPDDGLNKRMRDALSESENRSVPPSDPWDIF